MSTTFILDVSSYIHRAYHVSKDRPTYTKGGEPNAAVNVFRTMIHKLKKDHSPDKLLAACDVHEPTFRSILYPAYKAQRTPPDQDLVLQLSGCRDVLHQESIPIFEKAGFEADDVIGTLAQQFRQHSDVVIVSGDKDMAQLVGASDAHGAVRLLNTNLNRVLNVADVLEVYGVWPHQVVDYFSLVGDTSDNVPGCKGIGPGGALALLKTFPNVEAMIARCGEIESSRLRHAIMCYADMILLSKKLVTIDCNVPLRGN